MSARAFVTPVVACLLPAICQAAQPAIQHHASPTILSEFQNAKPGTDVRLIVSFKIDPTWHLYWDGQNDTGQPPQFTWKLPKGWIISPPQFPVPHRNVQPGDIVDYIYETSLSLGFTLSIPKDAAAKTEPISASIEWLECSDRCMFGAGDVKTNILVLDSSQSATAKPNPEAQKALEVLDSQIPKPWSAAKGVVMEIGENAAIFTAKSADKLEFFPGKACSTPKNALAGTSAKGPTLSVEFLTEKSPPIVDGILAVYRTKGGPPDYYRLSENPSLPKATEPTAPPIK